MSESIRNEENTSYAWVILAVCTALVTLAYGLSVSYSVFFKPLAGQFHWNRTTTSSVYSFSLLTRGLVAIGVGWASDKFGARAVLIFGGIVTGIGFILSSRVHTLPEFFFTYGFVLAVGLSGSFGIGSSLVARWFPKKSALPLGIFSTSSGLGTLLIVPLSASLLKRYGLADTFVICGISAAVLFVSGALLLRPAPEQVAVKNPTRVTGRNVTLGEALRYPELYMLMFVFFIFVFSTQIVLIHLVNYATDLGVTPLRAAGLISLLGLVSIAGRLLTGVIGERVNTLTLLWLAPIMTVASFILLVFSHSLVALYAFVALFGLAYGAEVPLTPMMAKRYFGTKAMATLVGVFQMAGGLGGFAGPVLAGRIFDVTHSYHIVFIIGAGIVALALVPILLLRRRAAREENLVVAAPLYGIS